MAKSFSPAEWSDILDLLEADGESFGLPQRRSKSLVLGTFNVRNLGTADGRSDGSWQFLARTCERFDLLAIQEVQDNLEGLRHLRDLMGDQFKLVVSDTTGAFPQQMTGSERLAFIYRVNRVERTELASEVTYDRSYIAEELYQKRFDYYHSFDERRAKLATWEERVDQWQEAKDAAADAGETFRKRKPKRPPLELPHFLTFIRQPHVVSFRMPGANGATPYEFLVVNAHLMWGSNKEERYWEFKALFRWLYARAQHANRLYYDDMLLLGDLNLEFEATDLDRDRIDEFIRRSASLILGSRTAADANLPLLTPHPEHGYIRTNARRKATYDQIGLFMRDDRLPRVATNAEAGQHGVDDYDYGVFRFTDMFAHALDGVELDALSSARYGHIMDRTEYDVSDHLPAWIRLRRPGM